MRLIKRFLLGAVVLATAFTAGVMAATIVNYPFPMLGLGQPTPASGSQPPALASPSPFGTAEPSGPPGPAVVLLGAGDMALCEGYEDELTADLVESIPGIVFTIGDHTEDGSRREFDECYGPTWGRSSIKERTRPTLGDNEYGTPGAAGYFEFFGETAGDPETGYYAYSAGAWRVYVLNSNCREIGGCEAGSAQERWLREDLAAHPAKCVLAMLHHPLFSSGEHEGSPSTIDLWHALYDAGAELVLGGQNHVYERFAPQTPDGIADPERGIVQVVVGTGGSHPSEFLSPVANSLVRARAVFGVLRLELGRGSYAFEFLTVGGAEFSDSGTGRCH